MADTKGSLKELKSYLDTRLNSGVAPIDPQTNVIDVDITVGPLQVHDLVDSTQELTCRIFMCMRWKDASLAWNASDYPNVSAIEIAPDKIWSPNVMVINAAVGDGALSTAMPISITQDGYLYWQNMMTISTICKTDLSRYPFDNQTCDITFSRGKGYHVILHPFINSDTGGLHIDTNGEWQTDNITTSMFIHGTSPDAAVFYVHLSRKHLFHVLNLIFPMCLLSFLNSFVFLLPASSGEKMSYLMSVFVSNALFLSLIHNNMPSTSDTVPHLSLFLVGIQIQGFLGIIGTIIVQNVYSHKNSSKKDGDRVKSNEAHLGLKLTQVMAADALDMEKHLKDQTTQLHMRTKACRWIRNLSLDRFWDGIFFLFSFGFALITLVLVLT
ncbi:acetylcholine receptor subunit delta-like [Haliotis asinina]|uniref:acetylcholine receptor subunit delta-like n=1 Tax=Haliotis asinina TaxID=109174 RepID=UPI003531886A